MGVSTPALHRGGGYGLPCFPLEAPRSSLARQRDKVTAMTEGITGRTGWPPGMWVEKWWERAGKCRFLNGKLNEHEKWWVPCLRLKKLSPWRLWSLLGGWETPDFSGVIFVSRKETNGNYRWKRLVGFCGEVFFGLTFYISTRCDCFFVKVWVQGLRPNQIDNLYHGKSPLAPIVSFKKQFQASWANMSMVFEN